jgi:hypothetical protein
MISNFQGEWVATFRAPRYLGENGYLISFILKSDKISIYVKSENGNKELLKGRFIIEKSIGNEFFIEITDVDCDSVFELYLENINCEIIRIPSRVVTENEIAVDFFNYNIIHLKRQANY